MNPSSLPPWLAEHLRTRLAHSQGHAWLVAGAAGLGQFEWALAAARAWLCETHQGRDLACGHCPSCHLVAARTHPDLLVLVSEVVALDMGWASEEVQDAGSGGRAKAKPSQEVKVEALRRAVAFSQTTSARGRGKVVVVFPAERMNHVSANTLLKTLEEPPGQARFLLATGSADRLLPTIRSRCQTQVLPWPDTEAAAGWLREQGLDQAAQWLRVAGGRPMAALALARQGLDAGLWQSLPGALARGDVAAVQGMGTPVLVHALLKLCADLMRVRCGAEPLHFEASALTAAPTLARLSDWNRALLQHARHAEHPWHAPLMLATLVGQARDVLAAPHRAAPSARVR